MSASNPDLPGAGFSKLVASGLYASLLIVPLLIAHPLAHADDSSKSPPSVITPLDQEQDFQEKQRLKEKINHELEDNRRRVLEQSLKREEVQRRFVRDRENNTPIDK